MLTKDFSLEVILTSITGINCTKNFNDFYEFVWFVFDNRFISGPMGLGVIKDDLKEHLLGTYPELGFIDYTNLNQDTLDSWLMKQKAQFGEQLPVSQIEKYLENDEGRSR